MGKSNDIRAAVIDDLTFDRDVDASDITVENRDGDVVLSGSGSNDRGPHRCPQRHERHPGP
jgi:osmotically-inducible protein OsmY